MKQISIAFILNRGYSLFHPECKDTYGGAQLDMYLLGQACHKAGYRVSYAFLDCGQKANETTPEGINLYATYAPRTDHGSMILQFLSASARLWHTAKSMNADVYCLEGANFEVFIIGLYCRMLGKKMIFRIASSIEANGRYRKENPLQGILYELGLRLASYIIVQTQEQHDALLRQGFKTTIIPNGYPASQHTATENGPILWVGRLIKIKRPDLFLDLAQQMPQQQFVMIGPMESIDQEYAQAILTRVTSLNNVRYFSKVDFRAIDDYFQRSSLLVNSSEYEGFPLTFLQAMRVGLPIMSFQVNPDNIVSETGGSVVHDITSAISAIRALHRDDRWKQNGERAKTIFQKRFSMDLIFPKYQSLFFATRHPSS